MNRLYRRRVSYISIHSFRVVQNLFIFYVLHFHCNLLDWIGDGTGKWTVVGWWERLEVEVLQIKGNLICIYTELDFHVQIDIKNSTEYSNSAQKNWNNWNTTKKKRARVKWNRDNRSTKKIYRKLNYMWQQKNNMNFHFSHENHFN